MPNCENVNIEDAGKRIAQTIDAIEIFARCPNLRSLVVMINDDYFVEHGGEVEKYFLPLELRGVRCYLQNYKLKDS